MPKTDAFNFKLHDNLTVNEVCKAHGIVVDECMRRLMQRGAPLNSIQHIFDVDNSEEYIVANEMGFHIEKAFTAEGRMEMRATPGYFRDAAGFKKWVDRKESGLWVPN